MNSSPVRPGFEFGFLNEWRTLQDAGWDNPGISRLWRYNLHYMDYLFVLPLELQEQIVSDWIAHNPVGTGTGWEPYPTSLRVVNWCKWSINEHGCDPRILASLALQAEHVHVLLERHLRGNHLLANAKALLFAGIVLEYRFANKWRERAEELLRIELEEQFLTDGMHFERSPMYHAICLVDVLDMVNLLTAYGKAEAELTERLRTVATRGIVALRIMSHPDGEVAFFNDSAIGIALRPQVIIDYSAALGITAPESRKAQILDLPDAGYVRLVSANAVAILDCAPVGPDYIPGHAHADTLSFELSVGGERVVVNTGTSTYEKSEERNRQRGTAAHSTVTVDGEDSSEVWGGFRVARRAHPRDLSIERNNLGTRVSCAHSGYRWLPGSPRHTRTWHWSGSSLRVVDNVAGGFHSAVARYHLHPDLEMLSREAQRLRVKTAEGKQIVFEILKGVAHMTGSTYHPEFGLVQESSCLEVHLVDGRSDVRIMWN